ncbi:MAG: hypothetical protein Q8Q09_24825 [Deltaproteobacteria bacterium]|nr:hypothetical protein [Deltaproteobacteria bacterium]
MPAPLAESRPASAPSASAETAPTPGVESTPTPPVALESQAMVAPELPPMPASIRGQIPTAQRLFAQVEQCFVGQMAMRLPPPPGTQCEAQKIALVQSGDAFVYEASRRLESGVALNSGINHFVLVSLLGRSSRPLARTVLLRRLVALWSVPSAPDGNLVALALDAYEELVGVPVLTEAWLQWTEDLQLLRRATLSLLAFERAQGGDVAGARNQGFARVRAWLSSDQLSARLAGLRFVYKHGITGEITAQARAVYDSLTREEHIRASSGGVPAVRPPLTATQRLLAEISAILQHPPARFEFWGR